MQWRTSRASAVVSALAVFCAVIAIGCKRKTTDPPDAGGASAALTPAEWSSYCRSASSYALACTGVASPTVDECELARACAPYAIDPASIRALGACMASGLCIPDCFADTAARAPGSASSDAFIAGCAQHRTTCPNFPCDSYVESRRVKMLAPQIVDSLASCFATPGACEAQEACLDQVLERENRGYSTCTPHFLVTPKPSQTQADLDRIQMQALAQAAQDFGDASAVEPAVIVPPAGGAAVGAFKATTLADHRAVSSASLKGKVYVVHVFATWASPSVKSVRALQALTKKYAARVAFLGVSEDDDESVVLPFAKQNGATFPMVWDRGHKIQTAVRMRAIPGTYLVDAKGIIKYAHDGYNEGDRDVWEQELVSLLK